MTLCISRTILFCVVQFIYVRENLAFEVVDAFSGITDDFENLLVFLGKVLVAVVYSHLSGDKDTF